MGPLHPVPPQAPHWSAPGMPEGSRTTPAVSNVGPIMLVDGGGHSRWMHHLAPDDQVCEDVHANAKLAVL